MDNLKIRPHLGQSSLDKALNGMGWFWLVWLGFLALLFHNIRMDHFWDSGGLVLLLFLTLPALFLSAVALNYFAQLEIEGDTLRFYGPQIQAQTIKISDITRINVILLSLPRGGEAAALEVVTNSSWGPTPSSSSTRKRIPLWFRNQDMSLVLQQIKAQSPGVIFDERAELLEQNKPLPS
jgi:hypothetical protein